MRFFTHQSHHLNISPHRCPKSVIQDHLLRFIGGIIWSWRFPLPVCWFFFWKRFPQVLTLLASFELLLSLFQIPWSPLFLAMKTITTDKTSRGSWATSVMYSLITSKGETNDCKYRNSIIVEQKETEFTFVSESGPFWRTMFYQVFCLR